MQGTFSVYVGVYSALFCKAHVAPTRTIHSCAPTRTIHSCAQKSKVGLSVTPKVSRIGVGDGELATASGTGYLASEADSTFCREVEDSLPQLEPRFRELDKLTCRHMKRSLAAFQTARLSNYHWGGSSGYGRGDPGRDPLEEIYRQVMGGEAACVRSQFQSGTHVIACALYGILRPGDRLLACAGPPYDTLEEVIGQRPSSDNVQIGASLADFGIGYDMVELTSSGTLDLEGIGRSLREKGARVALIQRSCGYTVRPSIHLDQVQAAAEVIKREAPECVVMVDNCYGEFVEPLEPTHVGADLAVGSLIKNPGGTIAPCGGYVVGRRELVEATALRLGAPGVGLSAGATPGEWTRLMLQGFFLAPQMVGEAVKGGLLVAEVMERLGYEVRRPHGDGVTAVVLGSEARLLAFCRAVMAHSPVNSYVTPVGGATPGYESEVVFADGTFIEGSTAELSCDGPLRPPYAAFCQGGTHWTHWAVALEAGVKALKAIDD